MPNFIWTAKDNQGKPMVKEVAAETIEESKAMLLAEGYTDLELKSDEIIDASRAEFADKKGEFGEGVKANRATEEYIKRLEDQPQTTLKIIYKKIDHYAGFYFIMLLLIGFGIFQGYKTFAITVGILSISWALLSIWMSLQSIYYAKLNRAKDWHQWITVLHLAKSLEKIRRFYPIKISMKELIRVRAQALSGLGRLPEALLEYQQCENQQGVPSWLYKSHLAEIYSISKFYDKSLEYAWEAVEEKQTPALCIDLAERLLRYKKDTQNAREVMSKIDKDSLTSIAKPYYLRCQGILDYFENNFDSARQELEVSLKMMEQTRDRPFRDGNISILKGYLCCVLAKQSDLTSAKKYFAEAKKYLIATEETDLLDECKRAIGE